MGSRNKRMRLANWNDYGIDRSRYKRIREAFRVTAYEDLVEMAGKVDPVIAEPLAESVKYDRSFDAIEQIYARKGKTIAAGRTDFYGARRKLYHMMDQRMREG